jgi:beta-xylosidase
MTATNLETTYTNPVYPDYFADPFVLRVGDTYYAYGTGGRALEGGRAFEILRSTDLVHWHSVGHALEVLSGWSDYWAPEVAHTENGFYLYYSAGIGDKGHQLRVAHATQPEGPFKDLGVVLTPDEPFAIDASPFRDDDGQWYVYYAKDFLDGARVGTALSVAKLEGMTRLVGESKTVLRATQDWQLYERSRAMYGRTYDWHTLEGPFVVKRHGRYWCFYSGGAWTNASYGVSYAVADHPLGPWSEAASGVPLVLKTIPGQVIGPGHNSLVTTSSDEDFIVYHAWDVARTGRRMCIDRVTWTADGPRTAGPTYTAQPVP